MEISPGRPWRPALVRLPDEGVVSREKLGRKFANTPILDEGGAAAARMTEILGSAED